MVMMVICWVVVMVVLVVDAYCCARPVCGDKEIAGPSRESRPGTHMGETGQDFGHHGFHERGHGNDQRIQILQTMGITHDAAHIAQEDQDQFERQPIHASKTEPSPPAVIGIGILGHDRDAGAEST